ARAIRPAHTLVDGDLVFALSVGERPGDVLRIGVTAANLVAEAIVRAVVVANDLESLAWER
ncbi:MAG: peptidase S58 family protein, partial [Calditrichaeota bacterium]